MTRGRKFWLCEECDYRLPVSGENAPQVIESSLLTRLPSIIAIPLQGFISEANPVLRLWHACDTVEMLLRLLVFVGLADIRRRGPLPLNLLGELRSRIEEPTLGKWRGMAEAVAKHIEASDSAVPEMPSLVHELASLLDGQAERKTAETSFASLRNQLAHGGGVTRAKAASLLNVWEGLFASAISHTEWLTDLHLVIRDSTSGFGILQGPTPQAVPYVPSDPDALDRAFTAQGEVLLVRGTSVLPLWPLKLYGVPQGPPDSAPARNAVPQVYIRRGEIQLQFTPVGSEEVCQSEADEAALAAFRTLLRMDEAEAATRAQGYSVRGFERDIRKDAAQLVGRAQALETLHTSLNATAAGVLWLSGVAGIGKSYLVARLVTDLLDSPSSDIVLPFRFKAGDDRCSRDNFLRFVIERLENALGVTEEAGGTPQPLNRLRQILQNLGGRHVLFVLDGLDEIAERDGRFAEDVVFTLQAPGAIWLCAGRPERGLLETFRPDRCLHPFPDGLPPMDMGDIRTMLLEKIGPLRQRLIQNDHEEGDQVVNPFVTRVAEAADGLPLYVRYVVGDVLGGRLRALDAGERLPPSLAAYHEELLRRCNISSLHQVVTPLVATLAVAKEPLTVDILTALLRQRTLLSEGERGPQLVWQALSAVAPMLRRTHTPEGHEGYSLYHNSLREYMAVSEQTRDAVQTAHEALCQYCARWQEHGSLYALRQYPDYLHEDGRQNELYLLLTDVAFIEARCENGLLKMHLLQCRSAAMQVISSNDSGKIQDVLNILATALAIETATLNRFPKLTAQTLINSCRWTENPYMTLLVEYWCRVWEMSKRGAWLERLLPPRERPQQSPIQMILTDNLNCSTLAFSADGKYLAGCGRELRIIVWDTESGEAVWNPDIPDGLDGQWIDLTWSADGLWVAAITEGGQLALWSFQTREVRFVKRVHQQGRTVSFCPPELRDPVFNWDLLTCGNDSYSLWVLEERRPELLSEGYYGRDNPSLKRPLIGAAWGKHNGKLAVHIASQSGKVVILENGVRTVAEFEPGVELHHIRSGESGRVLAIVADADESRFSGTRIGNDHAFIVIDTEDAQGPGGWRLKGHLTKTSLCEVDNRMLTCESDNGLVTLWSIFPVKRLSSWQGPSIGLRAGAVGVGDRVAVATALDSVLLLNGKAMSATVPKDTLRHVWSISIAPTGNSVVLARTAHYLDPTFVGEIGIVSLSSQSTNYLQAFTERDAALCVSHLPDGNFVSGHMDGSVRAWSPDGKPLLQRLIRPGIGLGQLCVSQDGSTIAASSSTWYDRAEAPERIHVLRVSDLSEVFTDTAGKKGYGSTPGSAVAFGGSDNRLLVCSGSPLRLWRLADSTWKLMAEIGNDFGVIDAVHWSANQNGFVFSYGSGTRNGGIGLIGTAEPGYPQARWKLGTNGMGMAVSTCGKYLVFADQERMCRVCRFDENGRLSVLAEWCVPGTSEIWSAAILWEHKLVVFGDSNGDIHPFRVQT